MNDVRDSITCAEVSLKRSENPLKLYPKNKIAELAKVITDYQGQSCLLLCSEGEEAWVWNSGDFLGLS